MMGPVAWQRALGGSTLLGAGGRHKGEVVEHRMEVRKGLLRSEGREFQLTAWVGQQIVGRPGSDGCTPCTERILLGWLYSLPSRARKTCRIPPHSANSACSYLLFLQKRIANWQHCIIFFLEGQARIFFLFEVIGLIC